MFYTSGCVPQYYAFYTYVYSTKHYVCSTHSYMVYALHNIMYRTQCSEHSTKHFVCSKHNYLRSTQYYGFYTYVNSTKHYVCSTHSYMVYALHNIMYRTQCSEHSTNHFVCSKHNYLCPTQYYAFYTYVYSTKHYVRSTHNYICSTQYYVSYTQCST